jgi:hypothetical protein
LVPNNKTSDGLTAGSFVIFITTRSPPVGMFSARSSGIREAMMLLQWIPRRRVAAVSLALIAGLMVLGCRAEGREQAAASGDVVIERISDPLRIIDIEIGRAIGPDNRVTEPTEDFRPDDTIYASVVMLGTTESATLKAKWMQASGTLLDETVRTISPTGETVAEFHLVQPRGWEKGRYRVEILLDGVSVGEEEFRVS